DLRRALMGLDSAYTLVKDEDTRLPRSLIPGLLIGEHAETQGLNMLGKLFTRIVAQPQTFVCVYRMCSPGRAFGSEKKTPLRLRINRPNYQFLQYGRSVFHEHT
ncbi:hypothetical protein STEG23_016157, partial [Scotinomys teguina]